MKNLKHIIKYAKELRKLIAAFESSFTNLDKYKKIFNIIYSFSFYDIHVESVSEYLQIERIDLQCNNELKKIFKTSKLKIDFYNTDVTKNI